MALQHLVLIRILSMQSHKFNWLTERVKGPMINESPDGGKTIRSRPSSEHPINMLAKGIIPIDTWYKIFKDKHDY